MSNKQDPAPRQVSRSEAAIYLALIISATIPYLGTVRHGYFLMDDFGALYLAKNLRLEQFLDRSFYYGTGNFGFFRPLGVILWRVNYLLYGFNPVGHHIISLIFHAVSTLLVFSITARLSDERATGFLAGLVFAVHPAHAALVSWLSCKYDLASTTFYLTGFLLYMKYSSERIWDWKRYAAVLFLEALAILSKEMAYTFPFALVLYEIFFDRAERGELKRALAGLAPFFIVAAGFFILRLYIFQGMGGYVSLSGGSLHSGLPSPADAASRLSGYLQALLFGFSLAFPNHIVVFGTAMLAALFMPLLVFMSAPAATKKQAAFLAAFTLLTFLPVINFSPIHFDFLVNSRYLYLSSFGFSALMAVMVMSARSAGRLVRGAGAISVAVILVCYLATLKSNNGAWIHFSDVGSSILEQFEAVSPGTLDGVDLTVYKLPVDVFGIEPYRKTNLSSALYFAYGCKAMDYKLECVDQRPDGGVRLSKALDPRYRRKVIMVYDDVYDRMELLYDSRDVKG